MEIVGGGLFVLLILVVALGGLVLGIWGLVDVVGKPDWAWQQSGENKTTYIVLFVLSFAVCQLFGWIAGYLYFFNVRPRLKSILASGLYGGSGAVPMGYGGYAGAGGGYVGGGAVGYPVYPTYPAYPQPGGGSPDPAGSAGAYAQQPGPAAPYGYTAMPGEPGSIQYDEFGLVIPPQAPPPAQPGAGWQPPPAGYGDPAAGWQPSAAADPAAGWQSPGAPDPNAGWQPPPGWVPPPPSVPWVQPGRTNPPTEDAAPQEPPGDNDNWPPPPSPPEQF